MIGVNFPDALPVEFIQTEDGQWGCQVPYSDNAGVEVVCGLECSDEKIGIIIVGKTIRIYSGDNGGSSGSYGGQTGEEGPPDHES